MNFGEALKGLNEGKKIKVPEWKGYWFKEAGIIKVFTAEGEILETPHFQQYIFRDDWAFVVDDNKTSVDCKKTTLQRLEEKVLDVFNFKEIQLGSEKHETFIKILDLFKQEYDNERDMVIKFAMGITPRMNHDDIVKSFDNKYRS